jgi:hypothetical protein
MTTITIELGENTHKLLCHIDSTLTEILRELRITSDTAELTRLAVAEGKVLPPVEAKEEELPGQMSFDDPAPVEEAPEAPAEEPAKAIELSDIQKKVVELSAAGKKDAVRAIVTKYASRVSAIPAEHTAEVWEKLTALEG